jgi:hypothetical protein
MSEPICKRVRIDKISLITRETMDSAILNFTLIEMPEEFGGNAVITRQELKKLNLTVGDELFLILTTQISSSLPENGRCIK